MLQNYCGILQLHHTSLYFHTLLRSNTAFALGIRPQGWSMFLASYWLVLPLSRIRPASSVFSFSTGTTAPNDGKHVVGADALRHIAEQWGRGANQVE